MIQNNIITKLASINVFELLVLIEKGKKGNAIADIESRVINLEMYRREKLGLEPITPSWIKKNLYISLPKANKIINKLIFVVIGCVVISIVMIFLNRIGLSPILLFQKIAPIIRNFLPL